MIMNKNKCIEIYFLSHLQYLLNYYKNDSVLMSTDPNFNQGHNNSKLTNNASTTKPGIKFNFKAPTLPPSVIRDDNKQKLEVNKQKSIRSTQDQKQHEAVRQRSRSREKKHYPRQLIIKEKQLELKKHLQIQKLNESKKLAKADTQNQQKIISTPEQVNRSENKIGQSNEKEKEKEKEKEQVEQQPQNQLDIPDNDELSKIMGFSTFKSTKNQNHTKSACEGVRKNTQVRRQYRQYMNRRGGFNRNLDKI